MTRPIREAADAKAELLADEICGCANLEQHRRNVKLITNALLSARVESLREAAEFARNAYLVQTPMLIAKAIRARADEIEKEIGS